eukprot:602142-Prymnesium_polylepis.1
MATAGRAYALRCVLNLRPSPPASSARPLQLEPWLQLTGRDSFASRVRLSGGLSQGLVRLPRAVPQGARAAHLCVQPDAPPAAARARGCLLYTSPSPRDAHES